VVEAKVMDVALRTRLFPLIFVLGGCSTSSGAQVDASVDAAQDAAPDVADGSGDFDVVEAGDGGPGAGVVACGAESCTIPSQVCCPQADGGGACYAKGAAPCTPLECDQPADCTGGTTCCYQFQNSCGLVGATCKKTCAADEVGACVGLADCQVCATFTCAGLKLTTCGTDGVCCK